MAGSMEGYRVVPWSDWSEWMELKKLIGDGNIHEANARIAVYRTRRRSAVPVSMLATASLLTLLKTPSPDSYTQRLSLSMVITRFVNGTTDRLQPRGDASSARSVYSLAVELGLPLILVEIRHQASHNVLPRLSTLTSGAKQALSWLASHYWEPQRQNIESIVGTNLCSMKDVFDKSPEYADVRLYEGKTAAPRAAGSQSDIGTMDGNENTDGALGAMKQLLKRVSEARKGTNQSPSAGQDHPVSSHVPKRRRKRWELCDNSEEWTAMPLGLAPGQKCIPRSVTSMPVERKPVLACVESNDSESIPSTPEGYKGPDTKNAMDHSDGKGSNDLSTPESTRHETERRPKRPRALTTEDQTFVARKRAEFEQIAKKCGTTTEANERID